MTRHIDAQLPAHDRLLGGGWCVAVRRALCNAEHDADDTARWPDETHPADCPRCLAVLVLLDRDEAASTLDVRRELAALEDR